MSKGRGSYGGWTLLRRTGQCLRGHRRSHLVWLAVFGYALGVVYTFNAIFYKSYYHGEEQQESGKDLKGGGGGKSDFLDTTVFQFKENADSKRILFWTKFYSEESLSDYCVRPDTLETCPYTKCEFTTDKSLLKSSDAIVFHGRDLSGTNKLNGYEDTYIDMPKARSWNQLWVFLMFEAPVHTWISLEPFDKVFNLTMTYRPDSDIHIPYGRVIPLKPGEPPQRLPYQDDRLKSTKKRGLVAWSVSNCYTTPSRRNEVVHELHKYISIDIFGNCGSLTCTPYTGLCDSVLECHEFLAKSYKFYLAFENSLCESYITEKFFDSLYVGMVPVVYGYGDYSRVAPKGSYIDATVFPSMKSLADYLQYLDRSPKEYAKYFEWRRHFRVSVSYFDLAWCSLCTKAWTAGSGLDPGPFQVKDLTNWWLHKSSPSSSNSSSSSSDEVAVLTSEGAEEGACVDPLRLKWDHTMFSFYGFMYYPHYKLKMGVLYGVISLSVCALFLYIVRKYLPMYFNPFYDKL